METETLALIKKSSVSEVRMDCKNKLDWPDKANQPCHGISNVKLTKEGLINGM